MIHGEPIDTIQVMEWLAFVIAVVAAWGVVRVRNASDGPDMQRNPNYQWWARGEMAKSDARLGRNVFHGGLTFLVVLSILLSLFGYH